MTQPDSKVENQKVERRVDREIAIDAPLKNVWRAVSEARALKNWFPLEARVTPGVGGKIFLSWGPEYEGEAEIIAWDPGKRLAWREPTALVDFTLESRTQKVVVRLVQSSTAAGGEWENEWFESTSFGWRFMLAGLRWWLEVHPDETRLVGWRRVKVSMTREEAYRRLTAADSLFTEDPAKILREGEAYELHAKTKEKFSGVVEVLQPERGFCLTLEELNKALLWFSIEGTAPDLEVQVWLSAFGLSQRQVNDFSDRWEKHIRTVFGV
jgi:uncharacterized protein YndB with AHSA1/START domain